MSSTDDKFKDYVDVSIEKDRGILKKIIKPGIEGLRPSKEDTCSVRYVGTFIGGAKDGEQFDANDPFEFQIGTNQVIKAWDIGVATMNKGEICELISSPEYGYSDGETRKFEVELHSFSGKDISEKKDGSVRKSTIEEGEGVSNPAYGAEVKISFKLTGSADAKEVIYTAGDPEPAAVPKSVDQAVRSMTLNELARVEAKEMGKGDDNLSIYEIKLLHLERLKHLSIFKTFPEKLVYAETLKNKANDFLKNGKYLLATKMYDRLHSECEYLVTDGVQEDKQLQAFKVVIYNNSALAFLKMKDFQNSIDQAQKSLSIDPASEKALFRIGQAYLEMKDHELAHKWFQKCVLAHQDNSDAVKMSKFCAAQIAKAKKQEKDRFRNIFNKLKDTGLSVPDEPEPASDGADSADESDEAEQEEVEKKEQTV